MVIATQHGRGKGSGVETTQTYGTVYELTGGEISSWTLYLDADEALEAASTRD